MPPDQYLDTHLGGRAMAESPEGIQSRTPEFVFLIDILLNESDLPNE